MPLRTEEGPTRMLENETAGLASSHQSYIGSHMNAYLVVKESKQWDNSTNMSRLSSLS